MDPYFYRKKDYVIATEHGAGPWDPRMLHGGAPSGLIASIVQNLPSEVPMSVTRLTIDLQRPVPVGMLDIDVNITREGRNIQTSEIILSANGKQVVRASALKIRKEELKLPEESAMPEIEGTIRVRSVSTRRWRCARKTRRPSHARRYGSTSNGLSSTARRRRR